MIRIGRTDARRWLELAVLGGVLATLSTGCTANFAREVALAQKTHQDLKAKDPCSLSLQLAVVDRDRDPRGADRSTAFQVLSEEVCIQDKLGDDIVVPRNLRLFLDPRAGLAAPHTDYLLCDDPMPASAYFDASLPAVGAPEGCAVSCARVTKADKGSQADCAKMCSDKVTSCTWNGSFREKYPFDIVLRAGGGNVGDRVQLIQVYRNGKLAYLWRPGQSGAEVLTKGQPTLVISGESLSAKRIPHLADFDLRLFPVGVPIDEALLSEQVEVRRSEVLRRLEVAGLAAIRDTDVLLQGKGEHVLSCFQFQIEALQKSATDLMGTSLVESPKSDEAPKGCEVIKLPDGKMSLKSRYEELKGKGEAEVKKELAKIDADVAAFIAQLHPSARIAQKQARDKLRAWYDNDATPRREILAAARLDSELVGRLRKSPEDKSLIAGIKGLEKFAGGVPDDALPWVEAHLAKDFLQNKLEQIDKLALEVMTLGDSFQGLMLKVRQDVIAFADSPKKQIELHNAVASRLENEGDFFDQYGKNPPIVGPEKVLPMKFSDGTQGFFLAPWTGIPLRVEKPKFEFSPTLAIPIIDVVGVRFQFADTRFADLRFALGFSIFEAAFAAEDDPDGPEVDDEAELAWCPQTNISLGNVKMGIGYILTNDEAAEAGTERLRILLGLDLAKLISGFNVEVL